MIIVHAGDADVEVLYRKRLGPRVGLLEDYADVMRILHHVNDGVAVFLVCDIGIRHAPEQVMELHVGSMVVVLHDHLDIFHGEVIRRSGRHGE